MYFRNRTEQYYISCLTFRFLVKPKVGVWVGVRVGVRIRIKRRARVRVAVRMKR
jgi:hypothetical protein